MGKIGSIHFNFFPWICFQVYFVISELPMHGELKFDGENITTETQFVQRDIKQGKLTYEHDHSDSLWDAFEYRIHVEVSGGLQGQKSDPENRMSNVFNITILPVNDQPFEVGGNKTLNF